MEIEEIYDGLKELAVTYIEPPKQQEVIASLEQAQKEGCYPPGKYVLACIDSDSNGISLKNEHNELWDDICHHCI